MTDEQIEIRASIIRAATYDTEQAEHAVEQSVGELISEICRLRARVDGLLAANTAEVERRRHFERVIQAHRCPGEADV